MHNVVKMSCKMNKSNLKEIGPLDTAKVECASSFNIHKLLFIFTDI